MKCVLLFLHVTTLRACAARAVTSRYAGRRLAQALIAWCGYTVMSEGLLRLEKKSLRFRGAAVWRMWISQLDLESRRVTFDVEV